MPKLDRLLNVPGWSINGATERASGWFAIAKAQHTQAQGPLVMSIIATKKAAK
jgi:hypothetical protein